MLKIIDDHKHPNPLETSELLKSFLKYSPTPTFTTPDFTELEIVLRPLREIQMRDNHKKYKGQRKGNEVTLTCPGQWEELEETNIEQLPTEDQIDETELRIIDMPNEIEYQDVYHNKEQESEEPPNKTFLQTKPRATNSFKEKIGQRTTQI